MTKPQLMLKYTLIAEGVPLICDDIVLEITRRKLETPEDFIGMEMKLPVEYLSGLGTESGPDPLDTLWNNFHDQKSEIKELKPEGDEIGVAYSSDEEGYFCYFAGAEADSTKAGEGCKSWQLPAGEYIVCSFEAENFKALVMDALYKAQGYLYQVWLAEHKLATKAFSVERYERHDPSATRMELWVMPVPSE